MLIKNLGVIMVKKIVKGPVGSEKVKEQWKKVYEGISKMRRGVTAPVDIEGASCLPNGIGDEKDIRFQTLVSLMLSSQTKDPITAKTVRKLQANGLTLERMTEISVEDLAQEIHGVSFHNTKAKHIKKAVQIIIDKFEGDIPDDYKKVISLPGVGPKMAHLFMQICYGKVEGIAVDTHVHRIANRLGWAKAKDPTGTMKQLMEFLPQNLWEDVNDILVGFGQTICSAKRPKCEECTITHMCPYYESKINEVKPKGKKKA